MSPVAMGSFVNQVSAYGGVGATRGQPALRSPTVDIGAEILAAPPAGAAFQTFTFHGGPVVRFATVYVSFWGARWVAEPDQLLSAGRLCQFMTDLLVTPYMNVLSQYGAGLGAGTAGRFVRASFISNLPAELSDADVQGIIQRFIDLGGVPEPNSPSAMAFMVFLDESVVVKNGPVMCEPQGDTAFGYHSYFVTHRGHNFHYAVIPALDDDCIRHTCRQDTICSLHLAATQEQRRTQVASHEYAELVTDPTLDGWYDGQSGAENGDICNGQSATITVGGNVWTVQQTYSKHDDVATNGSARCIVQAPIPLPVLTSGPTAGLPADPLADFLEQLSDRLGL